MTASEATAPHAPHIAHRLSGRFEVALPAHDLGDVFTDSAEARFGARRLDKRYHGALQASGRGLMLSAVTPVPGSAGYVALELVSGCIGRRCGSFVLQHSGLMDRGAQQLDITVVPGSAGGALAGLAGRMAIRIEDGQHFYDFECTLPPLPDEAAGEGVGA